MNARVFKGLAPLLAAAIALAGCAAQMEAAAPALDEPVGVKSDTAVVRRGSIEKLELRDASVKPYVEELYLTISGKVDKVYVTLGQAVKKGDPLVSLDQRDLIEQADSLADSIAHREGQMALQRSQRDIDVKIAQVELSRLQAQRTTVADAEREALDIDIRLKQADIEQMRMDIEHWRQAGELDLEADRARLKALRADLGKNVLIAPYDGRIVEGYAIKTGDWVRAYDTLAYLADDSRLSVVTKYLAEGVVSAASRVYAQIGDRQYDIAYQPIDQQEYIAAALSGVEMTSSFTIEGAPGQLAGVEAGAFALIGVVTKRLDDVLLVPTNALLRDANGRYVYVVDGDRRERREVEIGLSTDSETAVLSGLAEGEQVYVKS
ncbi:MAG: biotin/lipoyl-binding protein [Clostridiales bacterium]|nr:biotin/lipoyl-binding protein [Clostridiales bacterium]